MKSFKLGRILEIALYFVDAATHLVHLLQLRCVSCEVASLNINKRPRGLDADVFFKFAVIIIGLCAKSPVTNLVKMANECFFLKERENLSWVELNRR